MGHAMRRFALTLTAGLLAAGGAQVASGPAQAAATCPQESGNLCFWVDVNNGGRMGKVTGTNDNWGTFSGGCADRRWNDCASAIQNEGTRCEAVVWEHINHQGASLLIYRDNGYADLTRVSLGGGRSWNDVISSNNWRC